MRFGLFLLMILFLTLLAVPKVRPWQTISGNDKSRERA